MMQELENSPEDVEILEGILSTLQVVSSLIDQLDIQAAQNILFAISKVVYAEAMKKASFGDTTSRHWIKSFRSLAQFLNVSVE